MHIRLVHVLASQALLLLSASAMTAEGFTPLFNGVDLSGWHGNDPHTTVKASDKTKAIADQQAAFKAHWQVENGELVNDGRGPYATTDQEYGDLELLLEYKTVAKADSGVYLRGAPQVQIWDTTQAGGKWRFGADKGSGGLWNNLAGSPGKDPLVLADKPFGEWNQLRVILVGSRTWVWLNDQLVVDGALYHNYWTRGQTQLMGRQAPLPKTGPIHLQTHGGEVRWRNMYIREIGVEEANHGLLERDSQGYLAMFNGEDLAGWQGAVDDYDISDRAIHSKRGSGHIWTKEKYADFVWRMEFKVAPGANNGLAIRYPGHGDPAYSGMCEIQVLDDTADRYAKLDSRQYHGSIYGMVAPLRGYLRPTNEWNFQEVRVVGSHITVELNGNIIVDADQAQVKQAMGRAPNKVPQSGYLGFCGHGPGVAFRNLLIKELN